MSLTNTECGRPGCLCWMLGICEAPAAPPGPEPETPAATRPQYLILVPGTQRDEDRYTGVVRLGRKVVVECGHRHTNRDMTTKTNGRSARDCADRLLRAAHRPAYAAEIITASRNAWMQMRGPWATTAAQLQRAKVACIADADKLAATITQLRAAIAELPST
ncbi:hypothetical protein OOJ91_33530 [Micromonospora lupini]|uniref:hypothetical protein n=1 Tax=Micromonospora lupini TaxID=285679 RepID=UPI0022589A49|nr:hypothetical protein [Micromonospora lupini]MCX5070768.1 hypothetical protein [Micromonospora lupini]